jgi:hypothetical protein
MDLPHGLDWYGSGKGQVAGSCELSGSIKCGEFISWVAEDLIAFQEALCSMTLSRRRLVFNHGTLKISLQGASSNKHTFSRKIYARDVGDRLTQATSRHKLVMPLFHQARSVQLTVNTFTCFQNAAWKQGKQTHTVLPFHTTCKFSNSDKVPALKVGASSREMYKIPVHTCLQGFVT